MSKAFKPFNKAAGSSSDRTSNLRRETMYQAVVNSQNMNQLNDYQFTNRNFSVKPCEGVNTASGQPYSELNQVSSYKTYMDLAIGKRIVNPIINGSEALSMDGNMGAFYRLNVQGNDTISTIQGNNGCPPLPAIEGSIPYNSTDCSGVGRIAWPNSAQADTPSDEGQYVAVNAQEYGVFDNYPGYLVDPYSKLSNPCLINNQYGKDRKINENISVDARWLESYWSATGGQPLSGFSFPTSVIFGTQETLYDDSVQSYKVAPMSEISQFNGIYYQSYNEDAFANAGSKNCNSSANQNTNVGII